MSIIRRAFTLIELLVVIAIIAILAAILFPVFAQAKVAAKGAASLSNNKQILTAQMIYLTDYDDRFPLVGILNEPDSPFLLNGILYKPWSYLILPYMKSGAIYQDPLYRSEDNVGTGPIDWLWSYRTQFGYAYNSVSPVNFTAAGWTNDTLSQTSLNQSSETVLIAGKKARNNSGDWLYVGSAMWMANLIAPPYCNNATGQSGGYPDSICAPAVRWGRNGYFQGTAPPNWQEGLYSGGTAFRKANKGIVGFADGHAKAMSPAALGEGTNWNCSNPNSASTCIDYNSIVITDKNRYMWDAE